MPTPDHYEILGLTSSASQGEIKQAYRKLAKQFHPDSQVGSVINTSPEKQGKPVKSMPQATSEQIIRINAAYEVLGDEDSRRQYDRLRYYGATDIDSKAYNAYEQAKQAAQARTEKSREARNQAKKRSSGRATEVAIGDWMKKIYNPVTRHINNITRPLNRQINDLAADPFDDELMDTFVAYLEECRSIQEKADLLFKSMPNPASAAGPASKIYYAINHISDGLDELELFTTCYEESYIHSGKELFRRAKQFRKEAQESLKQMVG